MMENKPPTLKSLSQKIPKKKRVLKPILESPFTSYWPLVSKQHARELMDVMSRNLPRIRVLRPHSIPYSQIKSVPKDERKAFRSSIYARHGQATTFEKISHTQMVFGVNAVTTLLQKHEAAAIVVAADIRPRFLVQHIIDISLNHKCPLLVLDGLRQLCIDHCGFSTTCMAFHIKLAADDKLLKIAEHVKRVYKASYMPENLPKNECILQPAFAKSKPAVIKPPQIEETIKLLHLRRPEGNVRAFIPKPQPEVQSHENIAEICAQHNVDDKTPLYKAYQPLVVKQLVGNPKRISNQSKKMKRKISSPNVPNAKRKKVQLNSSSFS